MEPGHIVWSSVSIFIGSLIVVYFIGSAIKSRQLASWQALESPNGHVGIQSAARKVRTAKSRRIDRAILFKPNTIGVRMEFPDHALKEHECPFIAEFKVFIDGRLEFDNFASHMSAQIEGVETISVQSMVHESLFEAMSKGKTIEFSVRSKGGVSQIHGPFSLQGFATAYSKLNHIEDSGTIERS